MDNNRIITMKSILKKETGNYLYKQNRVSSFNSYFEAVNQVYYAFHMRNEMLFEGLKKSVNNEIKDKIKTSNKLHFFFIHDPMDVTREKIYETYVRNNGIGSGEGVIIIDTLPGRKGKYPKNDFMYAQWSARDVANNYSSYMSFIYHLITDLFSVVQVHVDSQVYDGDIIIDFQFGTFLNKGMKSSFKPEMKKKYDWQSLRTILNDRFSALDSISSDPLADTGIFKACADDFFLLFRVTIVDIYTRFLREDSVNTKNRIDTITERISQAEFGIINDEADKELDEMNDILNTRLDGGE